MKQRNRVSPKNLGFATRDRSQKPGFSERPGVSPVNYRPTGELTPGATEEIRPSNLRATSPKDIFGG